VQSLLTSSLLYENIKIKICRTMVLPVVYGCEMWSLRMREERTLRVFENRVLLRMFRSKRYELVAEWSNYIMRRLMICSTHPLLLV
jgi:hypothetical protein